MAALDPLPAALVSSDVVGTMVVVAATVDGDVVGVEVGAGRLVLGPAVVGPAVVADTVGAAVAGTVATVVGDCGLSTSMTCTSCSRPGASSGTSSSVSAGS